MVQCRQAPPSQLKVQIKPVAVEFNNLEPVLNRLPSHIIPIIPDIVDPYRSKSVKNHVWTGLICLNLICVFFHRQKLVFSDHLKLSLRHH